MARDLFFNNKWDKQIHPLSWLIKKFWPIKGWTDEDLAKLLKSESSIAHLRPELFGGLGVVSVIPSAMANHTSSMPIDRSGEQVTAPAMSLSELPGSSPITLENVIPVGDKLKVIGVTASLVTADMVDNGNIPSLTIGERSNQQGIHQSMNTIKNFVDPNFSVPMIEGARPNPTPAIVVNLNLGENPVQNIVGESNSIHNTSIRPNDKIDKGILYYTDNQLDPSIMKACQEQLLKSVNGYRIVSVSLQPIYFEDNIVLPLERGYLTLFKQILVGLEELNTDIVFMAEHDVLYSKEHFEFIPPEHDKYYYNKNWWKLRLPDGHCLQHDGAQTSGLCAYRDTLIKHYKQRVINTEKMWNELGGNTHPFRSFIRDQGFEPGTHHRAVSVDNLGFEYWDSPVPIVDIRHNGNLTANRWSIDQFRRKPKMWTESDTIPYWGKGIDIVRRLT
jgi:hypothetical protein